jgi:glucose/arabinose dehydrogenase
VLALATLALGVQCAGSKSASSGTASRPAAPPSTADTSTALPSTGSGTASTGGSGAAPAPPRRHLGLVLVASGLDAPTYVASPPGDSRLFVVEQDGLVRVLAGGRLLARPFLDLRGEITSGGEQGLLSIAFDPRYRTNRRFAVDFTNRSGDTRVVLYRADARRPNLANPATARVVLAVDQPYANHNGGQLQFGPDGRLYVSLGDGGSEGDPQNRGQSGGPLSTILRLDVDVPHPRAQVYAYGLRNPWRFSFDGATGDMWIGDVGQNAIEEIDYLRAGTPAGTNFGWSYYEGRHVYKRQPIDRSRLVFPVAEYPHSGGSCSVTGGYVYRGRSATPLRGSYVYADYCSNKIWQLHGPRGRPRLSPLSGRVPSISSFGEDARGNLYVVSLAGRIYRIVGRP